ncbi:G-type lectin S-receptor-like serine/threonine-protein kinase LECRK2 [Camellia lanceoleosa]|nr:G-type lectin S-receptor-like serine/threonine-protein kinase LECRK2 [Camellia lanceoleosa]
MDQSETHTTIRGTKGYVAPEWYRNMPITVKVDVFSFGVLLLEISCCRKNVDMEIGGERAILTYWAYDCYEEGMLHVLVENDAEAISDWKKLERFLIVAIWCIQEDPSLRPTMKKVMLMLEGILEVTALPCPHPFSTMGRS